MEHPPQSAYTAQMLLCGVDPGLERTGYAVITADADRPRVVDAGVLTSPRTDALPARLAELAEAFDAVLAEHKPALVAVESLYAHYNHPRTAIIMGHARGVLLMAAARHSIPVADFGATQIKKLITGNGRASKAQIQRAIQVTFSLPTVPEPPDVADALAVALCAAHSRIHAKQT